MTGERAIDRSINASDSRVPLEFSKFEENPDFNYRIRTHLPTRFQRIDCSIEISKASPRTNFGESPRARKRKDAWNETTKYNERNACNDN